MSEESETRDSHGAGGRAAEDSSMLRDALEPAAKEMGRALETMARALNLALAPISIMAWGYDAVRDAMVTPVSRRMRKGVDAVGDLMEEMSAGTFTEAAGKMIEVVSPALFPRKSSSADLAYDPELPTRELGSDEAILKVESATEHREYQFDFSVSRTATYVLQTKGRADLVLGLFRSEPPYRRITYKDDGGEGRNPRIRRELEPETYLLVVRRFDGERFRGGFELSVAPEVEEGEEGN